MTRRFSRRRFLHQGSAALAAALAGCGETRTARRPDGGDDAGPLGTGSYDASGYDAAWALDDDGGGDSVAPDFDLVVIGSGFAGTYLAQRAADAQLSTLIVEAGFDPTSEDNAFGSFGFTNAGVVEYPLNKNRIVALGGTSNHWGGVISRPYPDDFRLRSKYGLMDDWPIGYDDLETYFCESEQLLMVRGGLPTVGEAPRECAYPKVLDGKFENPDIEIEGIDPNYFLVPRSRETENGPVRLTRQALPAFEASKHGTLLTGQQVTRLVSVDGQRIDHIEATAPDGGVTRIGARWFVVAAGAIETPRLLLLSSDDRFPAGPGNDHDLVGRYFTVHPSFETSFTADGLQDTQSGEYRTFDLHDSLRAAGLGAYHFHLTVTGKNIRWRVQPEMDASRDNRIRLSPDDGDDFGNPWPELSLEYSDRDMETFAKIQEFIQATKTSLGARVDTVRDFERWRGHPAGATRMAASAAEGVVDADNRVFGTDNLFVSGASTFTTQGTANPTNLVVAMSLRLADHLIGLRDASG